MKVYIFLDHFFFCSFFCPAPKIFFKVTRMTIRSTVHEKQPNRTKDQENNILCSLEALHDRTIIEFNWRINSCCPIREIFLCFCPKKILFFGGGGGSGRVFFTLLACFSYSKYISIALPRPVSANHQRGSV